MYNFVDTTESPSGMTLPSEAMSYDGIYIENKITGYRTLYTTGRELMDSDIHEDTINMIDGTQYKGRQYPARDITVGYQLLCSSAEDFRYQYNELNKLLTGEQVHIIFADEPDKYFIGTKIGNTTPKSGVNNVTGEIQIHCTDPFKYSTTLKEFTASINTDGILEANIINNGAIAAPISYTITHNSESGVVGIISKDGVLQYGSVEEVDGVTKTRSEWLVNYKNANDMSSMTLNNGKLTEDTINQNGTLKTVTIDNIPYLALDNVGTGSYWHGASKTLTIPADSSGNYSTNFMVQSRVWFETGLINQTAMLELVVSDSDKNIICKWNLDKNTTGDNNSRFIVGTKTGDVWLINHEPNWKSVTNQSNGIITIRKSGELIEFQFGNEKHQVRDSAIADMKARYITIFIGQFAARNNIVTRAYFRELKYRADNVSYFCDIPNRYQNGDLCEIDGDSGKYYVNGVYKPDDEVLGSTYFNADPGDNKVQFVVSDWTSVMPTVVARIRERWL